MIAVNKLDGLNIGVIYFLLAMQWDAHGTDLISSCIGKCSVSCWQKSTILKTYNLSGDGL